MAQTCVKQSVLMHDADWFDVSPFFILSDNSPAPPPFFSPPVIHTPKNSCCSSSLHYRCWVSPKMLSRLMQNGSTESSQHWFTQTSVLWRELRRLSSCWPSQLLASLHKAVSAGQCGTRPHTLATVNALCYISNTASYPFVPGALHDAPACQSVAC